VRSEGIGELPQQAVLRNDPSGGMKQNSKVCTTLPCLPDTRFKINEETEYCWDDPLKASQDNK
jgi:hypothetical protein